MKKLFFTSALAFLGFTSFAQVSFEAKTNHDQEKAYGAPVEKSSYRF